MTYRLQFFDDFHLHGASAPEWNQRYRQLSPGAMRSTLAEATAGGVHVFRKWMSERVVQQGCLPAGQICFAVLDGAVGAMPRMQGHELRDDGIGILRAGQEFMLQRPRDMALLAVTFDAEAFRARLDARACGAALSRLVAKDMLQMPPAAVARLRDVLHAILDAAPASDAADADDAAAGAIFDALCSALDDSSAARQSQASASAGHVVAASHRIAMLDDDEPISVDALCRRLHTSRRHLQDSFRVVAGTTPVHYLRSLRLDAVRRRLMATGATDVSVTEAAVDQGFTHLSHFAARYRELYGELPSETARAAAECRSAR